MTNKKTHTSKFGFTLVELLMYFALSAILLVSLSSFFLTMIESKSQSHAVSAVASDGLYIMNRLRYDVNRATSIVTPSNLGDTSSSLVLVIDGQQYSYAINNGVLTLQVGGETIPLHSQTQASEFDVTRKGNVGGKHALEVSLRVTSPIIEHTGQETKVYQTTMSLR